MSRQAWEAFPGRYRRLEASEGAGCTWAREVKGLKPFQSWSAQQQTLLGALGFEPEEGRRVWIFIFISHPRCQPRRWVEGFCGCMHYSPLAPCPPGTELPIAGSHPTMEPELLPPPTPHPRLGNPRASMLVSLIVTSKSVHQRSVGPAN